MDNDNWEFPYTPETQAPQLVSSQGLDDAPHLLHYYSKVEHKQEVSFDDLPMLQRQCIMEIGKTYLKYLRYPGGSVPTSLTAGTTASAERSSAVRDEAIHQVVSEVFEKAKQQKQQKQRIEAKAMPKDQPVPAQPSTDSRPVKGPPAVVLEQRAKEAEKAKHKPPPKKLIEQLQQRPSADTPAKSSTEPAKATTETTVKLEPKQPKRPPPPKRPADRPAESASAASKKVKQEEAPPAPPAPRRASQNKMPTPPATARAIPPAPTGPSRAGPMPPPDVPEPPRPPQHARSRTPAPPNPPKLRAQQPDYPPPRYARTDPYMDIPTPPAPPSRARRSDTTDRRQPLPRQRPAEDEEPELFYPEIEHQFNEAADLEEYIQAMTTISNTVPDPVEERERRQRIWERLTELVERGVSFECNLHSMAMWCSCFSKKTPTQWADHRTLGGLPGRGVLDAHIRIAAALEEDVEDQSFVSQDLTKFFDTIDLEQAAAVLKHLRAPPAIIALIQGFYKQNRRIFSLKGIIGRSWQVCGRGLMQGCPFSPLIASAIMKVWCDYVFVDQNIDGCVYLDDRTFWTKTNASNYAVQIAKPAKQRSDTFDHCFNLECQISKCSVAARDPGLVDRFCPNNLGYGEVSTGLKVLGLEYHLDQSNPVGLAQYDVALANKRLQLIRWAVSARYARCALIAKLITPLFNWASGLAQLDEINLHKLRQSVLWVFGPHFAQDFPACIALELLGWKQEPQFATVWASLQRAIRYHSHPPVWLRHCGREFSSKTWQQVLPQAASAVVQCGWNISLDGSTIHRLDSHGQHRSFQLGIDNPAI